MQFIGAHVSTVGGLDQAINRTKEIGGNAFALFVKNQKRWFTTDLSISEIENFQQKTFSQISPDKILPHASYLINLANPFVEKRQLSMKALIAEIKRCESLGLKYLVLHPGSTLKQISEREGLSLISESLNDVFAETDFLQILLENTAGQGGSLGYCFEHLQSISEKIRQQNRIGICLDTCHLFAAGYDLNRDFEQIWQNFQARLGWKTLKGMHLNNSKVPCGAKVDRHAPLKTGMINPLVFRKMTREQYFMQIPCILETPVPENWEAEIKWLRNE